MKNEFLIFLVSISLFFAIICSFLGLYHQAQINRSNPQFILVQKGDSQYVIKLEKSASSTEKFAAEELQKYLLKITNVELPIATGLDNIENPAIIIVTNHPKIDFPEESPPDTFRIKTRRHNLILSGKSDRGTLYSVYTFLEKFLGARWFAPGPLGEIVPKAKNIFLPSIDILESPSFKFRIAGGFHSEEYVDWAIKNKLQIASSNLQQSHDDPEINKRGGYVQVVDTHSFFDILSPNKYFNKHPEYFSFLKGERSKKGQINVTNPEVINLISDKIIHFFEAHPSAQFFSLTPNDGYGWSEDPVSKAIDKKANQGRFKHHPIVSDRYFKFVNEIAQKVSRKYPDKYIYALAYVNYIFPPQLLDKLQSNVVVSIAHYAPADYAHPINSPLSKANRKFFQIIKGWLPKVDHLWFYSYMVKYAWDNLPYPIAKRLGKDIKLLKKLGFEGFYAQGGENRWGQVGVNYYVMAKLLWNADQSIDDVLDSYFKGMFGSAGREMKTFYSTLAASLTSPHVHINKHPFLEAKKFLTGEIIENAKNFLIEAKQNCQSQRCYIHVNEMGLPLLYAEKYLKMRKWLTKFEKNYKISELKESLKYYNIIKNLISKNKDLDSIPLEIIKPTGYFTLDRYFKDYELLINAIENNKNITWLPIYRTSFENPKERNWQGGGIAELPKSGNNSLILVSDPQIQTKKIVSQSISPYIKVHRDQIVKVSVWVKASHKSCHSSRGIVVDIIGFDKEKARLWAPWIVENQLSCAPKWKKLVLMKEIHDSAISRIKIRLGVSGGMGQVYFDDFQILRAVMVMK